MEASLKNHMTQTRLAGQGRAHTRRLLWLTFKGPGPRGRARRAQGSWNIPAVETTGSCCREWERAAEGRTCQAGILPGPAILPHASLSVFSLLSPMLGTLSRVHR